MATRVLLVDDHTMFRQGIKYILESRQDADIKVIGEAENGRQACEKVRELQPDVVVMDVHMPQMDGVRATRAIMNMDSGYGLRRNGSDNRTTPPAIVMLTMSKHDDYVFEAIKAGARGYYLKDSDAGELVKAINQAAEGEMILNPDLAQRVLREFRQMTATGEVKTGLASLGDREIDILRQVAAGRTNMEIADALGLSEKTIKNQLSSVFNKLHLSNRTQAAVYALRHGLVTLEEL